mgnify:CR=1 FL=1
MYVNLVWKSLRPSRSRYSETQLSPALIVTNDLLEMIHFILQRKELNDLTADLPLSEAETEIINFISKEVSTSTLIIFWQFIRIINGLG